MATKATILPNLNYMQKNTTLLLYAYRPIRCINFNFLMLVVLAC
jgi:hypothetical protein